MGLIGSTGTALPREGIRGGERIRLAEVNRRVAAVQGLTLVHLSAQRKRFVRDRGCMQGLLRGCQGYLVGVWGVFCVINGSG